jgi:hypothetical protein
LSDDENRKKTVSVSEDRKDGASDCGPEESKRSDEADILAVGAVQIQLFDPVVKRVSRSPVNLKRGHIVVAAYLLGLAFVRDRVIERSA